MELLVSAGARLGSRDVILLLELLGATVWTRTTYRECSTQTTTLKLRDLKPPTRVFLTKCFSLCLYGIRAPIICRSFLCVETNLMS